MFNNYFNGEQKLLKTNTSIIKRKFSQKTANQNRGVNKVLNQQFYSVFGTEQSEKNKNPNGTLRNLNLNERGKSKSLSTNNKKTLDDNDIQRSLFWSPDRQRGNIFQQKPQDLQHQKSLHIQIVVKTQAQLLDQIQNIRRRQQLYRQTQLNSIEKDEEQNVQSESYIKLNSYGGKLLNYPKVVDYLQNHRSMHTQYISDYFLGRKNIKLLNQTVPLMRRNVTTQFQESNEPLDTVYLFRSNSIKQSETQKRIKNIVQRYSQKSPVFINDDNEHSHQREEYAGYRGRVGKDDIVIQEHKQDKKYNSLLTVVDDYRKNRIKQSDIYKKRYSHLKVNLKTAQ